MSYVRGSDRSQVQLLPPCLDDYVPLESAVRFIDVYVEGLDFQALGFTHARPAVTGRPAYRPADLLKLYLYGYLYRIRSSRRLEAEAGRNVELMWLLGGLRPDFKTIADFRKDNRAAFKPLFKQFNLLCRKMDVFGSELVAIDGSKFKAVNQSRLCYNRTQLKELIATVEERIERYLSELEGHDEAAQGPESASSQPHLQEKIQALRERRGAYDELLKELDQNDQKQIAHTDRDARKMKGAGGYVVGYNVQLAVDAKHHLIVCNEVVQDVTDQGQLAAMAAAAKQELQVPALQVTADKGYHAIDELEKAEQNGVAAIVPESTRHSGRGTFAKSQFTYDAKRDVYECPAGHTLARSGQDRNHGKRRYRYCNEQACAGCPLRSQCTTGACRVICRRNNEAVAERTRSRVAQRQDVVKRRREIVEHVFGTLRNWGHDKFLMKGIEKVRAEFTLSALTYNLRRLLSLFPYHQLLQAVAGSSKNAAVC